MVANGVLYDKNLSMGAKCLYAYLYSKPEGWDFSALRIGKELMVSEPTILKYIHELEKSGYLERVRQSTGRVTYTVIYPPLEPHTKIFSEGKPHLKKATLKKSLTEDSLVLSNTDIKVILKEHSNTTAPTSGAEVSSIIELFKDINPEYSEWYKNTTQRKAVTQLIEKYGYQKVQNMVTQLPSIISKKYAPKITSPYELKRDLAKLILFIKQEKTPKRRIV